MTLAPGIANQTPGQSVCERVPSLTTLICIGAEAPGFFRFCRGKSQAAITAAARFLGLGVRAGDFRRRLRTLARGVTTAPAVRH